MDIKDFNTGTLSLGDFKEEETGVTLSPTSTAQIAASQTMLSGGDSQDFDIMKASLQNKKGRADFLAQQSIQQNLTEYYDQNVQEILSNPEISDDEKRAVLNVMAGVGEVSVDYLTSLAQTAYDQDESDETEESFESRTALVDIIDEVVASKKEQQKLVNAFKAERDQGVGGSLVDLGELIVPFAEWIQIDQLAREFGIPYKEAVGLGQQKESLFQLIQSVPFDQKVEFTQRVIDVLNENDNVIFNDGNAILAIDTLERMTLDNDYSNLEKWFDNVVSVLDLIGVGALAKFPSRAARVANTVDDVVEVAEPVTEIEKFAKERLDIDFGDNGLTIEARTVRTDVQPTATSQIVKETSPESARMMHRAVDEDASGRAAESLYGTNRDEALANDILPEPDINGNIPNKIYPEPETVRTLRTKHTDTMITDAEKAIVEARTSERLQNVEGMIAQGQQAKIRYLDNGATEYTMLYRPANAGFKTAGRAVEHALHSFREYGLKESDLTLYARRGDEWVETTRQELAGRKELRDAAVRQKKAIPAQFKDIDYAVGIKYEKAFDPSDLSGEFERLSVIGNIFDRLPPVMNHKQGSLQQHVMDPSSYLPTRVVEPASVLSDRAFALRKAFVKVYEDGFIKKFNKLPKVNGQTRAERQALVKDYIMESNLKGTPFNVKNLAAQGFTDAEIEALKGWKRANDALWHATNADLAVTLRNRGYQIIKDSNDTQLVGKPLARNQVSKKTSFFDPHDNTLAKMSKEELDEFYEKGGSFGRLSTPIQVNGDWIDIVKVGGTPESGYFRAIRDDDTLLAYRDGYYPVMYDAKWIIERVVKGSDGTEYRKAVASSTNEKDAAAAISRLQDTYPDETFIPRADRRSLQDQHVQMDMDGWNMAVNSGLSMQKVRGQRLMDASSDLSATGTAHLMDPLEAVAIQISQLSTKISFRNYLDTVKSRWIENYFDALKLERNSKGERYFPSSITELQRNLGVDNKQIADARSIFNYINHLENGYYNAIDESYKALVNKFSEFLGSVGWKGEKLFRDVATRTSPTRTSKSAAFKLFLASNPIRQLVIQGHQNVQLLAINNSYMVGGGFARDVFRLGLALVGNKSDKRALKMLDEIKQSGIIEAVDANNMVRQDILTLTERSVAAKTGKLAMKPLDFMQMVGFDSAEQSVLVSSWLAHRNKFMRETGKKTLTRRDLDEIAGKARVFTYNMNRAGDMPYNQNSLAIIAQFLQVPHKAMLQPFFNRSLTPLERGKLLSFNTVMYGVPAGLISLTQMPVGPQRDAVEDGLEDYLLNTMLTEMTGEETQIDFGDLAPVNAYGLYEFTTNMFTTDIATLFMESPSGSILFGGNARLQEAFKSAGRWVHLRDDYDDPELDTKLSDVAIAFANIFSGASNAFKAHYAAEYDRKISSLGNITDDDLSSAEAAFQLAGFRTKTEEGARAIREELYGDQVFSEREVDLWYNELKRHLARRGMTVREADFASRTLTEAFRVFDIDRPKFQQMILRKIENDVANGDITIFETVQRQMGILTNQEVRDLLSKLPASPQRSMLLESLDNSDRAQEEARDFIEERDN